MKYLITNADDYGYRPDISQAIIEAHLHGLLTSTTVLINFVSDEDVDLAKNTVTLGFGLHLNLTSGEPLTKTWQSKYGSFSRPFRNQPQQFDQEVWLPFFEKFTTDDIYTEYQAQFDRFVELFGKLPTHLDSHHYTSSYKVVLPAYVKLAQKYNLPIRRPAIWDVAANQHHMGNIVVLAELDDKIADLKTTNYFSLQYLNRHKNYLDIFLAELTKVADGQSIEVSFHPGFDEEWRLKDLEILKDQQLAQHIAGADWKLVHFGQL